MPDILLIGATGFTGRLITRYLQAHPDRTSTASKQGFTYAIAGRSKSKLSELAAELQLSPSEVAVVEVIVQDVASVENAIKGTGTKVVINAVGPYSKYSSQVVRACARLGVHYVDLAGETWWIYQMIQQFDYLAYKNSALIIPACGFDSLPSELGPYLASKTLRAAFGAKAGLGQSVSACKVKSSVSGGTIASVLSMMDTPKDEVDAAFSDWALSPVKGKPIPGAKILYSLPAVRPDITGGFWLMGVANKAIVHRGCGILARHFLTRPWSADGLAPYGPNFTYDEFAQQKSTFSSIMLSLGLFLGSVAMMVLPPVRWLVRKYGPQPGTGASDEVLEKGSLVITNVTSLDPPPDAKATNVHALTTITTKGDPGYLVTALMISEVALLLLDRSKLTPIAQESGGFLTPITACGDALIRSLERTGRFTFSSEVVTEDEEDRKRR